MVAPSGDIEQARVVRPSDQQEEAQMLVLVRRIRRYWRILVDGTRHKPNQHTGAGQGDEESASAGQQQPPKHRWHLVLSGRGAPKNSRRQNPHPRECHQEDGPPHQRHRQVTHRQVQQSECEPVDQQQPEALHPQGGDTSEAVRET